MVPNQPRIISEFDSDFCVFLQEMDASLNRPDPVSDPFSRSLLRGLFDHSQELTAALAGRPAAAAKLRSERYRLFLQWLAVLDQRKTQLQRARLESRAVPFSEIVRFEAAVRFNLALLRLSGEMHFRAIRQSAPIAAAAAERISAALRPATA